MNNMTKTTRTRNHLKFKKYSLKMKEHEKWNKGKLESKPANFEKWVFYNDTFKNESFFMVVFNETVFDNCTFLGVNFDRCFFEKAKFKNCNFLNCNFNKCNMPSVSFRGGCYYITNFHINRLSESSWDNLYLVNCAFEWNDWAKAKINKSVTFVSTLLEKEYGSFKHMDITPRIHNACPSHGSFIGWKICRKQCFIKYLDVCPERDLVLVKVEIPADAKRTSFDAMGRCRCSKVKVLEIKTMSGKDYTERKEVYSFWGRTEYKVGRVVHADSFDENRFKFLCAHGIYFFTDKKEAIDYAKSIKEI